jgi:hypothetical protein
VKLNGTHQLLPYADDVNLLGDNIDTIKKNTETLIDSSKEVGLEMNIEKTKYMLLSRHQNVSRNQDIRIANRSFGNLSRFKYLGTTVTNRNLIREEIKRRLNSGNACYHSFQNLLSSRLLSKNLKIRIYKTIILFCCVGSLCCSLLVFLAMKTTIRFFIFLIKVSILGLKFFEITFEDIVGKIFFRKYKNEICCPKLFSVM